MKICKCICHKKGYNVMHVRPCCQYTGLKYINEDGTIDLEAYNKIIEETK